MTPEELDAIRARCEAAAQGPWTREICQIGKEWLKGRLQECACESSGRAVAVCADSDVDAEFIAHAREDIPRLLAEIDALKKERDNLRFRCEEAEEILGYSVRKNEHGEKEVIIKKTSSVGPSVHRLGPLVEYILSKFEWQPIETAPKDGSEIILGIAGNSFAGFFNTDDRPLMPEGWYSSEDKCAGAFCRGPLKPTHWMPLPEPPEMR